MLAENREQPAKPTPGQSESRDERPLEERISKFIHVAIYRRKTEALAMLQRQASVAYQMQGQSVWTARIQCRIGLGPMHPPLL